MQVHSLGVWQATLSRLVTIPLLCSHSDSHLLTHFLDRIPVLKRFLTIVRWQLNHVLGRLKDKISKNNCNDNDLLMDIQDTKM